MQDEQGRILILGGTGEAMKLAAALAARSDLPALLSFAGRTKTPLLPSIPSRIGGFGGVDGLAAYMREMKTPMVIDATHPFAARITANAAQAAAATGTPLLRKDKHMTRDVFGTYIHTYKFHQAVADKVVLDLKYEARDVPQQLRTPEKIDAVAQGRVWTGSQAIGHGLVDRLGGLSDAVRVAAARAKLNEGHRVVYVEAPPGRLDLWLQRFGLSETLGPMLNSARGTLQAWQGTAESAAAENPFVPALRSLMRMDVDLIVLGEIRDAETAHVWQELNLTGHKLYATLHAPSACGASAASTASMENSPQPGRYASWSGSVRGSPRINSRP
jgi:hypothetical protein